MEENTTQNTVPDILTLVSKEKFRRKLLIASRIIAVFLIFAILWIGWLQISYVKEVNQLKARYGSNGYCYMCGLETFKACACQNLDPIELTQNTKNLSLSIAEANVKDLVCKYEANIYPDGKGGWANPGSSLKYDINLSKINES